MTQRGVNHTKWWRKLTLKFLCDSSLHGSWQHPQKNNPEPEVGGYYQSACHLVHNSYNLLNTTSTKARWITLQKLFHYFFVGATSCRPLFYWKLFEQVWPGDIHYLWWVPWIWYIFCIAWANAYLLTYTFRDYCYLVVAEKSHTGLQLKIIAQHYMGMPVMACSHKQGQNLKH